MRELLKEDSEYYVPAIIDHLSTERVMTSELIEGVTNSHAFFLLKQWSPLSFISQDTIDYISEHYS